MRRTADRWIQEDKASREQLTDMLLNRHSLQCILRCTGYFCRPCSRCCCPQSNEVEQLHNPMKGVFRVRGEDWRLISLLGDLKTANYLPVVTRIGQSTPTDRKVICPLPATSFREPRYMQLVVRASVPCTNFQEDLTPSRTPQRSRRAWSLIFDASKVVSRSAPIIDGDGVCFRAGGEGKNQSKSSLSARMYYVF